MAMDYMGHSQTATYMTGPRLGMNRSQTFLPDITAPLTTSSMNRTHDIYPAPSPLRRSMTVFPWKPSVYYRTAKVNPSTSISRSMPEPLSENNYLTKLDPSTMPSMFGNARNALYTRYTPDQWKSSNTSNWVTADTVRSAGERLRLDAVRLCKEADDRTKRAQGDSEKRLGERIKDIEFWERELKDEENNNLTETNKLAESKRILDKTLAETANPLKIAQECLYEREKRQGIDLVHDEPEKELIDEVEAIKNCQERLRQLVDRSNSQLNLNRAAQHELECDKDDKHSAMNIDSACHNLRDGSRGMAFHNGIERVDNSATVPETWAKFTADNIERSQAERGSSKQLRDDTDKGIQSCMNEMWNHFNKVNEALSRRIQDTTDARNRIQKHLSTVMQEVFDMEKHVELLKKAIQDKENPLRVAQTRLRTRTYRPNVEACRDPAQNRLVEEVYEIYESVDELQHKLREAENTFQHLLQSKSALEQDLAIKNNSLFLDQEKCLSIRRQFPMTPVPALLN